MEHNGEHKRDKTTFIYWASIGFGIGVLIGASSKEWAISLAAGVLFGLGMAFFATKAGVDQ